MQNLYSYSRLHHFWRYLPSYLVIIYLFSVTNPIYSQSKIVIHGLDKDSTLVQVNTGDKYYDSGGPGGSRLPDQPGNYQNCSDPFNESTNCTSKYTFCAQGDTVAINFTEYLIVTGDRLRIFSGTKNSGTLLYNSQTQGVSINGMRLTTGTLLKSKSPDGCVTVEWFCTTIGNSIGWEADIIVNKKTIPGDESCTPLCNNSVLINFSTDTCFVKTNASQYFTKSDPLCTYDVKIFYPSNSDQLNELSYNHSHVGKTFLFQVQDSLSTGSCVGYVSVKETDVSKSFCARDTIDCVTWEKSYADILQVNTCAGTTFKIIKTTFIALDCASDFVGKVYREIERLDINGTQEVCQDTLYITKMSFDSLYCPMDIHLDCAVVSGIKSAELTPSFIKSHFDLNNDNLIDGTDQTILPALNHHLISDTSGLCKTSASFTDMLIPGCGTAYKIRREWILNNACSGQDSVCVQYIFVEDSGGPDIPLIKPLSFVVSSLECKAEVQLSEYDTIKDCSLVNQRIELSYPDPASPGKTIVLNALLPVMVTLPPGGYLLKYTFADQCFNATRAEVCLMVTDNSKPVLKPISHIVQYANIKQCSPSLVAKELDSLVSGSCCDIYHLAVASLDSILYYRAYWKNLLKNQCSSDSFESHAEFFTELIETWITAYVFKDSLDLTRCTDQQVVVRAYKACGLPERDSGFGCSDHLWYCYHAIPFYRSWYNSQSGQSSFCPGSFNLKCKADSNILDPSIFNFKFNADLHFDDTMSCMNTYIRNSMEASAIQYAEEDFSIKLRDTSLIALPLLPDLIYFTKEEHGDTVPNSCCAVGLCKGESFAPNAWPGRIKNIADTIKSVGYFGGPVHSGAIYDTNNYYSYAECNEYDTVHYIRPVYCQSALMDSPDSLTELIWDTIFYKPVFNKIPGGKEFEVRTYCDTTWTINHADSITYDVCNQENILRMWTLHSACGQSVSLIQRLFVKRRSDFEVIFPSDQVLDCSISGDDTALINQWIGKPEVSVIASKSIKINFSDSILQGTGCKTMMRTWTIIDSCFYNPLLKSEPDIIVNDTLVANSTSRYCVYRSLKDGGDGIMRYKQLIQYKDNHPPTLHFKDTVLSTSEDCTSALTVLQPGVRDDCSPFPLLLKKATVDIHADGIIDRSFDFDSTITLLPGLAIGKHLVKILVTDICGNIDSVVSNITVIDQGPPQANCMPGINTLIIPSTGLLDVMASDFDAGSLPGCGGQNILNFSFSKDKNDQVKHLTCDSLGNKTFTVWVSNNSNQQASCTIRVQVNPAFNACVASQDFKIEGLIQTNLKSGISGVTVKTNLVNTSSSTNTRGFYSFNNLARGTDIVIRPQKIEDPANGLSTIDLLLIEKHIKGQAAITDPYLLIAADVNRSSSVSVADLIEIRKLILGTSTSFANVKSWMFVPKSFVFSDPSNPWIFPETIEYNPLNSTISDADFVGMKMGDVNNSALLGFQQPEARSNSLGSFYFKYSEADKRLSLFSINDIEALEGLQLGFSIPPSFHFKNNMDDQLNLEDGMFNNKIIDLFKLSWISSFGKFINKDKPLISFESNEVLPQNPIYFSANFQSFMVNQDVVQDFDGIIPIQNDSNLDIFPNPSSQVVMVNFNVVHPEDFKAYLTKPDGSNFSINLTNIKKGQNRILLTKSELGSNGVFYFVIVNGELTQKKMFIMF